MGDVVGSGVLLAELTPLLWVPLAAVVAVVTTFLGSRLLGVRRGWVTVVVSGVVGWGAALVVAAAMSDWVWRSDGLLATTIVLGIPLTMVVMLGLDLLARPGTLAGGRPTLPADA